LQCTLKKAFFYYQGFSAFFFGAAMGPDPHGAAKEKQGCILKTRSFPCLHYNMSFFASDSVL